MPSSTPASQAITPPPGRSGGAAWAVRLAWWAGWLLLALVSMTVAYGALVFAGW